MKSSSKIIIFSFFSILLFTIILFLGFLLSKTSGDINTSTIIALIISISPFYMFIKNLNSISLFKTLIIGITIFIIDYIIFYILISYSIFTKYLQ